MNKDTPLQYMWIQLSNMVALVDALVADQNVDLDEDASTVEASRQLVQAYKEGRGEAVEALVARWERESE